jgi:hypothetical protein
MVTTGYCRTRLYRAGRRRNGCVGRGKAETGVAREQIPEPECREREHPTRGS